MKHPDDDHHTHAVTAQGISKRFKRDDGTPVQALEDVSISARRGSLTALVGQDGAGKTTFLRLVAGLMRADAGELRVLGIDPGVNAQAIQNRISYVPQRFGLYEDLSVQENLDLYADLHGVSEPQRLRRLARLMEVTALGPFRDWLAGRLSGGMKQKLALACALIRSPELLVLDEPTVGVDPLSRRELWTIMRQLVRAEGQTFIVSTSDFNEADKCDEAVVLHEGKVVAAGDPAQVRSRAHALNFVVEPCVFRPVSGTPGKDVVIEVQDLVRKFGSFVAVDQVSFDVRRGEIFGLMGANGAGKTTTFRMLCGLLAPTSGNLRVLGVDLRLASPAARQKIGYVAQKFALYGQLTVLENLEFFGGAYGLRPTRLRERIAWAMRQFELEAMARVQGDRLPGGFRQRLAMAAALLHEPEILFLDEPTSGADPPARHEFWRRITTLAEQGTTSIITTHFMEEADYCDRLTIQDAGRLLAIGTPADIRSHAFKVSQQSTMEDAFIAIVSRERGAQRGEVTAEVAA